MIHLDRLRGFLTTTRRNVIANFSGRVFQAVLSLAVIPIYVRLMGIEEYGLVGVLASMQLLANIFDFGLSATMGREMARLTAEPAPTRFHGDLVRTCEVLYWSVGVALGVAVAVASRLVPPSMFVSSQLTFPEIQRIILFGAVALVMQWPASLYTAAVMGLQFQGLVNTVASAGALLRAVASVSILAFVSPHAGAFVLCQAVVVLGQTIFLRIVLWRHLRSEAPARFQWDTLRRVWRFAASMSLASSAALVLSQMDRFILLPILPLSELGYYVVAGSFAAAAATLGSPISDAVGPRYAQLVAAGRIRELIDLFHRAAQGTALLLFPVVSVCCVFASEVVQLWSRSEVMRDAVAPVLALLVVANCVYVFAVGGIDLLQAAYGSLRTSTWGRFAAILAMAPLLTFLGARAGARGAAFAWLSVYSALSLALPLIVLRRWPAGSGRQWLARDFALPLAAAAFGSTLVRAISSTSGFRLPPTILIAAAYSLSLLLTMAVTKETRRFAADARAMWPREGRLP